MRPERLLARYIYKKVFNNCVVWIDFTSYLQFFIVNLTQLSLSSANLFKLIKVFLGINGFWTVNMAYISSNFLWF